MGLLPGEGNYYSTMQEVRKRHAETRAQIGEATMIRDELRTQIKSVPKFLEVAKDNPITQFGPGSSGPESDLQIRILELQQVIDSLLTRYTDQHPDVQSAERRLAFLQKQLEGEQGAAGSGSDAGEDAPAVADPGKRLVSNPVYEQIKLQLV